MEVHVGRVLSASQDADSFPHDAFISYSRKDEAFAKALEQALESYKPPKDLEVPRRSLDVFRDRGDFTAGDYYEKLGEHLKSSAKLIVVCSPHARASTYVDDEIRRFVATRGVDHIIPVLLSGIPNNEARPENEDRRAFPDALCEVLRMPLAANFTAFDPRRDRFGRGVFADGWYAILAEIYGKSRSIIEQREKKRQARTRRLRVQLLITGLLVLAIAVVSILERRAEARRNAQLRYSATAPICRRHSKLPSAPMSRPCGASSSSTGRAICAGSNGFTSGGRGTAMLRTSKRIAAARFR